MTNHDDHDDHVKTMIVTVPTNHDDHDDRVYITRFIVMVTGCLMVQTMMGKFNSKIINNYK